MKPIFSVISLLFLLIGHTVAMPLSGTGSTKSRSNSQLPRSALSQPSDVSQTIIVNANTPRFSIRLPANPTTGYQWFLTRYNHDLIQPLSYRTLAIGKNALGAPGQAVFSFKVDDDAFTAPHVTRLTLTYVKPWEAHTSKGQTQQFTVITVPTLTSHIAE